MSLLSLGAGMEISSICTEMAEIVQFVGYVVLMIKIIMPLVIIVFGIIDFGKAVVSEKEDDIKKYAKRLLFRILAGVIIFLVPNFVLWVFGLNANYQSAKEQASFETCESCFLYPWTCSVK